MDLDLSKNDRAFAGEVRAFLDEELTPEMRADTARQAGVWTEGTTAARWHKALYERGWIAPAWPKEYGGPGWSPVERYIFESECALAGAPVLPAMGLRMLGPVLMRFGTPEQKAFYLPRLLSGEHHWAQGYSEPQAGSDLAALQCRAERQGDAYVVSGTKIWTTHAHLANWLFCLVRTRTEAKPQLGISFLLIPMDSPSLSVRPLITLAGDHEVNQVFFDDVRVPAENLVGEENDGWSVAKYLLEFERGSSYAPRLKAQLRRLKRVAREEGLAGDPDFVRRIAEIEVKADAIDIAERRLISAMSQGGRPGDAQSSLLKLQGTEALQQVDELLIEAIGTYAQVDQKPARHGRSNWSVGPDRAISPMGRYLNNRAATIYGGSSEVQRNILAKLGLGL